MPAQGRVRGEAERDPTRRSGLGGASGVVQAATGSPACIPVAARATRAPLKVVARLQPGSNLWFVI